MAAFQPPQRASYGERYASLNSDNTSANVRLYRSPRSAKYYRAGYISGFVDSESIRWSTLTKKKVAEKKQEFKEDFPSVSALIDSYNPIDQGREGACSFVGFLNCAALSGRPITRQWKKYWKAYMKRAGVNTAPSIGGMLDIFLPMLTRDGKLSAETRSALVYVPIRGVEEQCFNVSHWDKDTTVRELEAKGLADVATEYDKSPFIFENCRLVENLIDRGYVVEINAFEHSRTCVAYNDTHLLFADNWDASSAMQSQQTGALGKPIEDFGAGFSRVDKWYLYSFMRDLLYFEKEPAEPAERMAPSATKRTKAKRRRDKPQSAAATRRSTRRRRVRSVQNVQTRFQSLRF